MTRHRLTVLTAVLFVSVAIGSSTLQAGSADTSATRAKIVFVNVEQGDGVVMRIGGQVIVSDAGEHRVETVDATLRSLKAKQGASIWCTDVNGSVTARISAAGRLTWRASLQVAPWWSAKSKKKTGSCVGR